MANLLPDPRIPRNAVPAVAVMLLLWTMASGAQENAVPTLQPDMPITLDADSSEFDYNSSRLVFRGLRLDQGNIRVQADVAETERLDFTDGLWVFSGNVQVDAETARLYCDEARLTFRNHQLTRAELFGSPARFEQDTTSGNNVNSGEAGKIVYELDNGILELTDQARFSDGANEISGELISYDLNAGKLTAGSGSSGPVRIYIEPPANGTDTSPAP